jgi:hypothetical protein
MESRTLHQNLVCIDGARGLFYLHSTYYGIPVPDFDTLSPRTKQLWVDRAAEAIEAVGPARPTLAAELAAGKVIGIISPEEPYGRTA